MSQISFRSENQWNYQHRLRATSIAICLISAVALAIILIISRSVHLNQITVLSIGSSLSIVTAGALLLTVLTKLCEKKQHEHHLVGERTEQKSRLKLDLIFARLEHEIHNANSSDTTIGPDNSEVSNLFSKCQDPEIAFIPREVGRACSAFIIYQQDQMDELIIKLQSAFLESKKMVFTILSTGGHAIAAGFSSDGSFIIIDSMVVLNK